LAKKRDEIEGKHLPTKRQLSRHRREERIQRITYIVGITFIAAVVAFCGYLIWNFQVKPFRQPAIKINDVTYDMNYYLKSLALYSRNQDPSQVSTIANNVVDYIEYNQAMKKYAADFGITASKDEIDTLLENQGLADNQPNRDGAEATLLQQKLIQNHFDKEVPASVEQVDTQALFAESQETADKARAKAAAGDNFTALVVDYDLEPLTRDVGGNLGWLPKDFAYLLLGSLGNSSLKDIPFTLQAGEVSQPVFDGTVTKSLGYWVVQVTETDPTKGNHVRGILTGSRHDAEAIREKIVAGDNFTELVAAYSQDFNSASIGGEIGWTTEATIANRIVLGLALPLSVGEVSQPGADSNVTTAGGFWVVKAVDRDDNRALDKNTRQGLANGLFNNWINTKMKDDKVETVMTDQQKSWAIDLVVKGQG